MKLIISALGAKALLSIKKYFSVKKVLSNPTDLFTVQRKIMAQLSNIYNDHFARYLINYVNHYPEFHETKRYAQSHALFGELIKMKNDGWNRAILYNAYRQIIMEEIAEGNDPVLKLNSAQYFWQKVIKAEKVSVESVLVHRAKEISRYNNRVGGRAKFHKAD